MIITEPGVYDITEAEYHRDPVEGGSLSSTGARRLLPPSCPAKFRWFADHPQHSDVFDFGKAAHKKVLGAGAELVVIQAKDWRTNAAKSARDEAHAAGQIPILAKDASVVDAMAAALLADPIAGPLFAPGRARSEQTLVWPDRRTGVMRRALLDRLEDPGPDRMLVTDYKTCDSAEPEKVGKAIWDFGYYMQGDWYLDGVFELDLARSAAFLLVCQEKTPPYLVTVAQLHPDDLLMGKVRNDYAIDVYRECVASGQWPGYQTPVVARVPGWAEIQYERARQRGDYQLKEIIR